ncbi:uncharacterized protein L3040_004786 [Drepanopeziza brunnea f. sp. 'multigermtubi']|uniref:uncharacterized protein n=1 Tax=Drepanopeziza brunnea f. sp. 'multigermtubi' TaxID=698441 RepID=UPI00239B2390|nr:hypothetical protein L3040_004786 [Drepanopeziza brunnea f. sp. 'multigermtubi']
MASSSSSSSHSSTSVRSPARNHSSPHLAWTAHRLLSSTTLSLLLRAYLLSLALLRSSLHAALYAAALGLCTARVALATAWTATESLRRRVFFEVMVFLLGGGQGVFLVLFWPGWVLLTGLGVALWTVYGDLDLGGLVPEIRDTPTQESSTEPPFFFLFFFLRKG